ncbi:hypothetical protein L218DRAFT_924765 [Marasmius fiardii PR-910]|nr:hypothetical protein L218DRAFT_924765 [Marasmius fiardii PR-910]
MEVSSSFKSHRGRGGSTFHDGVGGRGGRPISRNKQWVAGQGNPHTSPHHQESERWERGGGHGGHRGGHGHGRGRGSIRGTTRRHSPMPSTSTGELDHAATEDTTELVIEPTDTTWIRPEDEPVLETADEREAFYKELVKSREAERRKAIAEGKMDDPTVPKRLEDAITIIGTCPDMCPRFERYRRERENNLFEWETIPGTKRVDHARAVKMYERAAGDKVIPSDLRPPHVLRRTLNYLFNTLLPQEGFSPTFNFIRDRSRAVRNDFTMQHEKGELAIECHERCARFHILALHIERDREGFSFNLEQQQLMNTLQSLKEFYEDQQSTYTSPHELEMRVYHRLIHIRDQRDRHEFLPPHISSNPVFTLTNAFRAHVQKISSPITKTSKLRVDQKGMEIFGELVGVLRVQEDVGQGGGRGMIYLIACLLESLFGKEAIEDIESLSGGMSLEDIIDGAGGAGEEHEFHDETNEMHQDAEEVDGFLEGEGDAEAPPPAIQAGATPMPLSVFGIPTISGAPAPSTSASASTPATGSAFSNLKAKPSPFGPAFVVDQTRAPNPFGPGSFGDPVPAQTIQTSAFHTLNPPPTQTTNVADSQTHSQATHTNTNVFGAPVPSSSAGTTERFTTPLFPPPTQTAQNAPSAPVPSVASGPPPGLFSTPPSQNLNHQATPFVPLTNPNPFTSSFTPPSTNIFSSPSSLASFPSPPPNPPHAMAATTSTPSSFSSQPPMDTRFSALPKLDTSPTTSATSQPQPQPQSIFGPPPPQSQPKTPIAEEPPRLARQQPISLPSTPTSSFTSTATAPPSTLFSLSSFSSLSGPSNPRLDFLKGSLQTANLPRTNNAEMLSPLQIQSPSVSRHGSLQNFTGLSTPVITHAPSRMFGFVQEESPLSGKSKVTGKEKENDKGLSKGKGKEKATSPVEPLEEQLSDAASFERRSTTVKDCWNAWRSQTTSRLAYREAVGRSEMYRDKIRREDELSKSTGTPEGRKRRISLARSTSSMDDSVTRSPLRKRARKRVSAVSIDYQAPRTDEELARRLKENQEEHQRRWAPESFLQVVRTRVADVASGSNSINHSTSMFSTSSKATPSTGIGILDHWRLWLSLNPDSDATAIWMEKKFGVPDSGEWVSETVFSVPMLPKAAERGEVEGYPGVVVFECTPLEGADELEKKYRILDDCSRLREVFNSFPPQRYFVPSILIVWWTGSEGESQSRMPESDLSNMLNKLVQDSIITSFCVFSISATTKDLDAKFHDALGKLTLDVEGRLIRAVSLTAVFRLFDDKIRPFMAEWIENCAVGGEFNWIVYGRLVQAIGELLRTTVRLVAKLLDRSDDENLPVFMGSDVDDSPSAYEAAFAWLSEVSVKEFKEDVAVDLQGHQALGKVFPSTVFLDHLRVLAQYHISNIMGNPSPNTPFYVLTSGVETSLQELQRMTKMHQATLSQVLNLTIRRSPKRRSLSNGESEFGSKRLRLSASAESSSMKSFLSRSPTPTPLVNGHGRNERISSVSPGPSDHETVESVAGASTETLESTSSSPMITVAMLRALTKDLKEKYGGSPS